VTYEEIVEEYRWRFRPHTEAELAWFRSQPSLRAALRMAAFALKENGKRYSHQRWLKDETAEMALDVMLAHEKEIAAAPDFDALHALLTNLLAGVPGAREMYAYDAAFRIGAKVGKLPSRVYLHRGTRDGARALGFDPEREHIDMNELPVPLRGLDAFEAEDVLCLHKAELGSAGTRRPLAHAPPRPRRGC
jgi:hypothetical protein